MDDFLDSTWAMYGGKPSDPAEQVRIGIEYMQARYGGKGAACWYDGIPDDLP